MSERESWHKEIDLFFVAMGYFTRIPMPSWVEVDSDKLNKASRYFGLVGLLVGLLSAIVFWLTQNWLPAGVSVLLAMLVGVLLTGDSMKMASPIPLMVLVVVGRSKISYGS
ncbi:hypothetical protein GCM10025855_27160 [Shewanella glacialipiscicola]|uniref:Adenosylcobinamide-GDP ribazoletransferase n=1 Tax=Shewanella glacialipiscicola TaxID=614069 RepID=A0ABQ6J4X6_9GAMM|nr:hypothetical protein GCM10025855_27160 [Shewanella glacialipiscicola]